MRLFGYYFLFVWGLCLIVLFLFVFYCTLDFFFFFFFACGCMDGLGVFVWYSFVCLGFALYLDDCTLFLCVF